jgi:hypothetical protein
MCCRLSSKYAGERWTPRAGKGSSPTGSWHAEIGLSSYLLAHRSSLLVVRSVAVALRNATRWPRGDGEESEEPSPSAPRPWMVLMDPTSTTAPRQVYTSGSRPVADEVQAQAVDLALGRERAPRPGAGVRRPIAPADGSGCAGRPVPCRTARAGRGRVIVRICRSGCLRKVATARRAGAQWSTRWLGSGRRARLQPHD